VSSSDGRSTSDSSCASAGRTAACRPGPMASLAIPSWKPGATPTAVMWTVQSIALRRLRPQPQRCAAGYQQWPSRAVRSGDSRMSWVLLVGESSGVTITATSSAPGCRGPVSGRVGSRPQTGSRLRDLIQLSCDRPPNLRQERSKTLRQQRIDKKKSPTDPLSFRRGEPGGLAGILPASRAAGNSRISHTLPSGRQRQVER